MNSKEKPKQKTKDEHVLEYLDDLEKDVNRYIPGTLSLKFQRMFDDVITREQPTHISYKDMENLKFQMMLLLNHYVNPNSFYICFPIKMEKQ